ncbi:MAG: TIR domain-containing protein [Pyrinomonadaceae bacterium]
MSDTPPQGDPTYLFFSYAHEDEDLCNELINHLSNLKRQGVIKDWYDRHIEAGKDWEGELLKHLDSAGVILLLVSANFMASDYISNVEVKRAMQRHRDGQACVIPVILRPCYWADAPFSKLQMLPTDARPVTSWRTHDDAFLNVVQGIRKAIARAASRDEVQTYTPPLRGFTGPGLAEEDERFLLLEEADARSHGDERARGHGESSGTHDGQQLATQASADEIPFQAVDAPSIFTGREAEIAEVEEHLRSRSKVVILRGGLGGIGKTALAATVAHRMRGDFADGILWGRPDVTDSQSALISFISSFGARRASQLKYLLSDAARAAYYRDILSKKHCLIVLDNVENARQVTNLLPSASPSKVLITTRYPLMLEGASEVALTTLVPEAAAQLFAEILGPARHGRLEEFEALAAELGHLPLAIRIAANIMRYPGSTAADYLKRLKESTTLDWLGDDGDPDSVRKSFAISYQELPSEEARHAFRMFGALEEQSVGENLISHMLGLPPSQTGLLLLTLTRRGLVEVEEHGQTNVLLHPLIKRYAYELLVAAGEEEATHVAVGDWYREGLEAWDSLQRQYDYTVLGTVGDIARGLKGARHYQRAGRYDRAQDVLVAIADITTLHGRENTLLERLDELARVTELVPWLEIYRAHSLLTAKDERRVAEGERILEGLTRGDDLKVASAAFITLARARFQARRYAEAEQLLHQSRELKEQLSPPDLKGLAFIENELAHVSLHNGGKYSDALESHRRALAVQHDADDAKGMAYTLRRIGTILLRHFDQPEEALKTFDEGKRLADRMGANPILVLLLIEEADALRRLKYFADALETLETALETARQCDDPFPEAHVLRRLGAIYEDVEFFGRAAECLRRCKAILDSINPEEAVNLNAPIQRVGSKIEVLERELEQVSAHLTEAEGRGDRAEARVLRRRAKRIRQRLNLEPALVRLGHRGKYSAAAESRE